MDLQLFSTTNNRLSNRIAKSDCQIDRIGTHQMSIPVLFVRGFNTKLIQRKGGIGHDEYSVFETYFRLSNYRVEFFDYSPKESLDSVIARLDQTLAQGEFRVLIGHSMGGGLLFRYMASNPDSVVRYERIILLMPMIQRVPRLSTLFSLPSIERLSVPKMFLFPNQKLFRTGNILNDNLGLVPIRQLVGMYRTVLSDDIPGIFNKHPNCYLFYADKERFSNMSKDVLDRLNAKNVVHVEGHHECFNSILTTDSSVFFQRLTEVLRGTYGQAENGSASQERVVNVSKVPDL